jgi:hypothetical protein
MADLSELFATVGNLLVNDATLAALLGDAQQVYQDRPAIHATFPCLTLAIPHEGPQHELTGPGAFRPVWRIIAYGASQDALRGIMARLNDLLDIPRTVPSAMVGTAYKITSMRQVDGFQGPPFTNTNMNQEIQTLVSIWNSLALPVE